MKGRAIHWLDAQGALEERVVVVALGGNLGGPHSVQKRCMEAIQSLSVEWGQVAAAGFFLTAPVGEVQEQPDFLNTVAAWRPAPAVTPESALAMLQALERRHGRERLVAGGARTLDLDLLLVGQDVRSTPALALPHPRMHQRAFVLVPLQELFGPDFRWTEQGASIGDFLATPDLASQRCRAF